MGAKHIQLFEIQQVAASIAYTLLDQCCE